MVIFRTNDMCTLIDKTTASVVKLKIVKMWEKNIEKKTYQYSVHDDGSSTKYKSSM